MPTIPQRQPRLEPRHRKESAAPTVRRGEKGPLLRFAVSGLLALAVVGLAGLGVLRQVGQREAIRDSSERAELGGHGIMEPALDNGLLVRDPAVLAKLDQLVQERLLRGGVIRVKLWAPDGTILYSDEPRIIGQRFALGDDEVQALADGNTRAELSDVNKPENRYERFNGKLLEVYLPLRTPNGSQILYEIYERFDSVASSGSSLWKAFAFPLLGALALLWLIQLPVAVGLGRRLQRGEHERAELLEQAIEASAVERSRIAGELHDGIVQELAGLSYDLAAAAGGPTVAPSALVRALDDGAARSRAAVRQMRAVLLDLHPADVHATGLSQAISDLASPLVDRGVVVQVDVDPLARPTERIETTMFRAAREGLRNVGEHSEASCVHIRFSEDAESATLVIEDNGRGFSPEQRAARVREGHVGLSLIEGLATRLGGHATIESTPGKGTRFVVEVPAR